MKNTQTPEQIAGNKIIAQYMELISIDQYRKSGAFDINGVEVLEGSIINANGYNSNLAEKYFHCVEYCNGQFGSDIYSDFEPLSRYQKIEVIGHCTDYAELVGKEDYEGNLGAALKTKGWHDLKYHSSYDALIPVIEKILNEDTSLIGDGYIPASLGLFNSFLEKTIEIKILFNRELLYKYAVEFINWKKDKIKTENHFA